MDRDFGEFDQMSEKHSFLFGLLAHEALLQSRTLNQGFGLHVFIESPNHLRHDLQFRWI
jgi:hypothetical protein